MGKPKLFLREVTKRPEIAKARIAKLVGTNSQKILLETEKLLNDKNVYLSMDREAALFGDGRVQERIV